MRIKAPWIFRAKYIHGALRTSCQLEWRAVRPSRLWRSTASHRDAGRGPTAAHILPPAGTGHWRALWQHPRCARPLAACQCSPHPRAGGCKPRLNAPSQGSLRRRFPGAETAGTRAGRRSKLAVAWPQAQRPPRLAKPRRREHRPREVLPARLTLPPHFEASAIDTARLLRHCPLDQAVDMRQAGVGSARAARLDRRWVGIEADNARTPLQVQRTRKSAKQEG